MHNTFLKSGYLNSDFKIFHLADNTSINIDFHYHDFYKILIFKDGNVSYIIENRQYKLCPDDIILINAGEVHKPVIHSTDTYDRIIIYISSQFFNKYLPLGNILHCFNHSKSLKQNLVRLDPANNIQLQTIYTSLAQSCKCNSFGNELYQGAKLLEYLVLLNRFILADNVDYNTSLNINPTIKKIIEYINSHITDDLSIDSISKEMFLNRSYIMHLFKKETGATIGNYITEKRLSLAIYYINNGLSITEACYKSGFKNYSSFYHAYHKKYNFSPKNGAK